MEKYDKLTEILEQFVEDINDLGFETLGGFEDGSIVIEIRHKDNRILN